MMVLVRWCYNVDCHSVGRVPSSYPRGVRRPTALLWFYPIPFLFVVSVCPGSLGNIRFGLLVSCSFSLSLMPLLFVSPCVAWSRFLFRPPFMFMETRGGGRGVYKFSFLSSIKKHSKFVQVPLLHHSLCLYDWRR